MNPSQPPEGKPDGSLARNTPSGAGLRASDSDRERAVSVLQAATADGRLSTEEMEERLKSVYSAKSRGELASAVQDLQPVQWANDTPTATRDVGVINDFDRTDRWVVGDHYSATAIISTALIDLRNAEFTSSETTIRINSWISTVYVVVPPDAEVRVQGTGILGSFKWSRNRADYSAARRITVTGLTVCANVYVVNELPPDRERRLQQRRQKSIR